jgi:hypothetical protein
MADRTKIFEGDKFLVESLVIAFDLTATFWVVWSAEDQFDSVFLRFSFEDFGDKLFSIIEVNFTRDSSGAERSAKSVHCRDRIFVKVYLAFHSIS